MDLVNPKGEKVELPGKTPAEAAAADKPGAEAATIDPARLSETAKEVEGEAPRPPLYGEINQVTGIMRMEVNLSILCERQEMIDQFMGFMERHKAVGLNTMVQLHHRRAAVRAAMQNTQHRNGKGPRIWDRLRRK